MRRTFGGWIFMSCIWILFYFRVWSVDGFFLGNSDPVNLWPDPQSWIFLLVLFSLVIFYWRFFGTGCNVDSLCGFFLSPKLVKRKQTKHFKFDKCFFFNSYTALPTECPRMYIKYIRQQMQYRFAVNFGTLNIIKVYPVHFT